MAATQNRVAGQIRRGGGAKGGGGYSALAGTFGVKLTAAQRKGLMGKDEGQAAAALLKQAGLEGAGLSKEEQLEFGRILKTGNVQEIARIQSGEGTIGRKLSDESRKKQTEKTEAAARAGNPLMDKVEQHLSKMVDLLTPIAADIKKTAANTAAANKSDKDTEKGSTGSDQPGKP